MYNNEDIPRLEAEEKIKLDIDFENLNIKKKRGYPFFLVFLLILLVLISFLIFEKSKNLQNADEQLSIDASQNVEEVWGGAFVSREIFDACREVSVSVIAEGKRCSGFVYSSDGWIATVEGVVDENVKGQIEVVLFDGRRYFVEAFRQNRESGLILLKINASDLKAVELDKKAKIFAGEELFTFCSVDGSSDVVSLFSGKVAHTERTVELTRNDGGKRKLVLFRIGILLTEEGEGAPLFNENGELVGIACALGSNDGERYMVDHAFAFSDVKDLLSTMRSGKRAGDIELFWIIAK